MKKRKMFFFFTFFGRDILLNMSYTVFKLYMLILDTMMVGTLSQISYLGPTFYFMKCGIQGLK